MMKATKKIGNKDFLATSILVVVLFIASIGAAVYLRVTAPPDDGSYLPGEQEITPEIELLQDYLRIETTAGREIEGARFLIDYLKANGVEAELIMTGEGRGNVYARLRGRTQGEGLMLLHHIDVKPAGEEGWTRPPFAAEIHLNRLYGRGVLDMKGVGIAELVAFVDLAKSGRPLERDLVYLAVADEEQGSRLGMRWLVENRPELFEGIGYAINEGGITEMIRDKIEYYAVEIGGKQIWSARIVADDAQVLEELRDGWEDLLVRAEIEDLLPEVDQYLKTIAPHRRHFGPLLEDIRKTEEEGRLAELHPSYLALLQNNLAVSRISTREDGRAEASVVLWYLPGVDPAQLIARVRGDAEDVGAEVYVDSASSPGVVGLSSLDTPFFDLFAKEVKKSFGEDVTVGPMIGTKGVTDCRFLRARGVECYGIWPFPVTIYDSAGIHGDDERLRLDWYMEGVDLIRRVTSEWVLQ